MKLVMQPKAKQVHRRSTDVFRTCMACESPNLLKFEGDVFCLYCDWNSIEASVDARLSAQYFRAQAKQSNEALSTASGVSSQEVAEFLEDFQKCSGGY